MKVLNATRKKTVTEKTVLAKSTLRKSLGLMFRSSIGENEGLLLEFRKPSKDLYSIWMFGMRFPIDIIFIGPDRKVTDVYSNAPPASLNPSTWKVYRPTKPVKWILEIAGGKAEKTTTSAGDRLVFE